MWGEGLSKAALEALVSLHLREFDCSSSDNEGLQQGTSSTSAQRPFSIPGITEHDSAVYTVDYSIDADAYLLNPIGASAAARSKSQQAWEALKAATEKNLLRLLQEAVPNIRIRLEGLREKDWCMLLYQRALSAHVQLRLPPGLPLLLRSSARVKLPCVQQFNLGHEASFYTFSILCLNMFSSR
ncbi:uncharacterized protein EMH_0084210 [Eimeria mitis]|uniref:Uncharacterized protein n=1 Tax=Eimeria mitis TaxID=44415 RepID=U6KER6_9EIME|nr:uncharacterized protein EMH_0084210 [Eimeria mitis]CDJ36419.1 hypothetical protein, conserved [Eimeria mitis]